MSKLYDELQRQLESSYKKEAEDCIKIYNKLAEISNGSVWSSQWNILTDLAGFIGKFPDGIKCYKPSKIGEIFLKGIKY